MQKIFEHIEPEFFFNFWGGAHQTPSSVGRGHPLPTLYSIGASNLASLALSSPHPPSENPKYASG